MNPYSTKYEHARIMHEIQLITYYFFIYLFIDCLSTMLAVTYIKTNGNKITHRTY